MSLHRFFLEASWVAGVLPLTGPDTHHLCSVLRARAGDEIVVVDPDGRQAVARLDGVDETISATFVREIESGWTPRVTLAQGVAKNPKMDLVVQKATELGMEALVPLLFERSVVRIGGSKVQERVERWQRIAQEASKQSQRSYVPRVHAPLSLDEAVPILTAADHLLVFWEEVGALGVRDALVGASSKDSVTVVVGPEGGLTREEIDGLIALGGRPVSLGPTILRTETAGITAVALAIHELGGLGGVRSD